MSKQAIICFDNAVGKVLGSLLADGFVCNDVSLDLINDPATLQTNGDTGILFVWADDFYQKGVVDAVSWFTRLRIAEKSKCHNWPVIILGYDSYPTFLRYFKAPRILVSPGIEYIQLPCSLRTLKETVDRIATPSETQIRDYIQDHDHARRLGDRLTHDLGNFYAMFRLLDGAYISGDILEDDYLSVLCQVEDIQREKLKEHSAYEEFLFLRGGRINNLEPHEKPSKSKPLAEGKKILLIDDAASLGWAYILACLLGGAAEKPEIISEGGGVRLEWPYLTALGSVNPLDKSGENSFVTYLDALLDKQDGKDLIKNTDLILLDLRLRRNEDEKIPLEGYSGIKVLEKIRQVNAGVPIIMLTASRKAMSLKAVTQFGSDDYFIKESGNTGEQAENIQSYYEDFKSTIRDMLRRTYLRDIWIEIREVKVNSEVRGFFKQAFALIRQQPSKYDKEELSYTPYAAAIVALGNAIEKYVDCAGYQKKYNETMKEFYITNPNLEVLARHIGFLRNNAAHPQSAKVISETDVRIAVMLALWCIIGGKKDYCKAGFILGIQYSQNKEVIVRKAFSYMRKKINTSKKKIESYLDYKKIDSLSKGVFDSDIIMTYLSLLVEGGLKTNEPLLLTKVFERFSTLISDTKDVFEPRYEKSEKKFPSIREAFWDNQKNKWFIPGCNLKIEESLVNTTFKKNYEGHTQSFLFQSATDFEAWGPPIPFGEYSKENLIKMLTVDI